MTMASLLWKGTGNFADRQRSCRYLLGTMAPSLERLDDSLKVGEMQRFPAFIEEGLNAIFHRHYETREKYLLFGQTDDEAYGVQEGYALEVAKLLQDVDVQYASRVHLCLGKICGRGAVLLLLCSSSIEAMWEVCKSPYYREQFYLVS